MFLKELEADSFLLNVLKVAVTVAEVFNPYPANVENRVSS